MTFPNESRLRSHQLWQAGMRDQGSSVQMPDFNGPADQANANRQVATVSTTQPAAYAQSQSTGTGIGGNMQPLSALPPPSDVGVMNTWADTKGGIPNPPDGYNPQLTRTEIASPEEVRAQEMLARYVGMIKEAGRQRQA